ncbi:hypothetical protein BAPA111454_19265 [Bacillus paranthracis]
MYIIPLCNYYLDSLKIINQKVRRKLVLKKIKDITKILTQREEVEEELKAIISKVVKVKKNLKSIDLKVNKQN